MPAKPLTNVDDLPHRLQVPLSPPRFGAQLRARVAEGTLAFTSGADLELVVQLYEAGFVAAFDDYRRLHGLRDACAAAHTTDALMSSLIDDPLMSSLTDDPLMSSLTDDPLMSSLIDDPLMSSLIACRYAATHTTDDTIYMQACGWNDADASELRAALSFAREACALPDGPLLVRCLGGNTFGDAQVAQLKAAGGKALKVL